MPQSKLEKKRTLHKNKHINHRRKHRQKVRRDTNQQQPNRNVPGLRASSTCKFTFSLYSVPKFSISTMTMYGYKPSLAQINDDLGCSCSLCCANNEPCKSSSNPNKPETLLCENVNSQVSLISYAMIFFRTALWYHCVFLYFLLPS